MTFSESWRHVLILSRRFFSYLESWEVTRRSTKLEIECVSNHIWVSPGPRDITNCLKRVIVCEIVRVCNLDRKLKSSFFCGAKSVFGKTFGL